MPPIQLKPHSFFGGTWTQPKLRLGLESIIPELGGDLNALLLVFLDLIQLYWVFYCSVWVKVIVF